jgi:hypothetical protein
MRCQSASPLSLTPGTARSWRLRSWPLSGVEELPVSFGDRFDFAAGDLDGGSIVASGSPQEKPLPQKWCNFPPPEVRTLSLSNEYFASFKGEGVSLPAIYKMLMARAASSATVANEISACTIISTFAQRESTGESVGENAVLVLNAMKR